MATAANTATVSVATSLGGSYSNLVGAKDFTDSNTLDAIDVTAFDDGIDRTRIVGLRDNEVSVSGTWQSSGTGFGRVTSAFYSSTPTTVFLQVLKDGTNGYKAEYWVTKFDVKGAVDGAVTVDITFSRTGASTAVP